MTANVNKINNDYHDKYLAFPLFDGIDSDKLKPFMDSYFNSGNPQGEGVRGQTGYFINQGKPVLIYNSVTATEGHAMLVIGYDGNTGDYMVLDPDTGKLTRMTPDQVNNSLGMFALSCL